MTAEGRDNTTRHGPGLPEAFTWRTRLNGWLRRWARLNRWLVLYLIAVGILFALSSLVNPGTSTILIAFTGAVAALLGVLPESQRAKSIRPVFAAGTTFLMILAVSSFISSIKDIDARAHIEPHRNTCVTNSNSASFTLTVPDKRRYLTIAFRVRECTTGKLHNYCEPSVTLKLLLRFGSTSTPVTRSVRSREKITIAMPPGVSKLHISVRYEVPEAFTDCAEDITIDTANLHN